MTFEKNSLQKKSKITLIGAGLVGSLWAVILKQRGYEVVLFEKRSDIRKMASEQDRSINLVITSRGLHGLAKANLLEQAIDLSVPVFGRMIHTRTGEAQFQPYGSDAECNFSISRAELNKFLLTAAEKSGVKIYFDHELEHIDFEKKTLRFNQDKIHQYELLFGTDGAGSLVRKNLCKQFSTEFQEHIDWLDADYKELFMPAGENKEYKLEKNALHIWPRGSHMMMALANLDGSFTVTLYMPQNNHSINHPFHFAATTSEKKVTELFTQDFNNAIPLIPNYAKEFLSKPQGKLGTVRCSKWTYDSSVVLMGDAAHAIVPFFGQGMNCGFEDCLNFLKTLDDNKEDWTTTIPQFEKIQKPNAHAIAEMAIENWTEMRDKVGDTKFLFRKKVETFLEKIFPKLFKSRYGMVTYTMIPYAIAREVGKIHDQILGNICEKTNSIEEISITQVEKLLESYLLDFIHSHNLTFTTDPLIAKIKNRKN